MRCILILVLFNFYGCASQSFKGTDLNVKVVSYIDPSTNSLIYDYDYKNGILEYKKLVSEQRINSDAAWSCFKNTSSVNYLDINLKDVTFLRSLHVDMAKTISYEKEDLNVDEKFLRKYREISSDTVKVNSRKCLIKKDSVTYYVISEIYKHK